MTIKKAYDPLTLFLMDQISSQTCQEGVGVWISASRMPLHSNCGADEDESDDNDEDNDDDDDVDDDDMMKLVTMTTTMRQRRR